MGEGTDARGEPEPAGDAPSSDAPSLVSDEELRRLRIAAFGRDSDDATRADAEARLARIEAARATAPAPESAAPETAAPETAAETPAAQPATAKPGATKPSATLPTITRPTTAPDSHAMPRPRRLRRGRIALLAGSVVAAAAIVVTVVALLTAHASSGTPTTQGGGPLGPDTAQPDWIVRGSSDALPDLGQVLSTDSPSVRESAAITRFFTHPVTPPAAIVRQWGLSRAGYYEQFDTGATIVSVRFQRLGTVAGVTYWASFGMDSAGGGAVCLVTQDMLDQSTCRTLGNFLALGRASFATTPDWNWRVVTWKPDGSFGLLAVPGVDQALASSPAVQALNNDAPDLATPDGTATALGALLQTAVGAEAPVFGEVKSADGTVFGLASDTRLSRVCISPIQSPRASCGTGAQLANSGLVANTAKGDYAWSPDGEITPLTE